jgi:hypothetical protein
MFTLRHLKSAVIAEIDVEERDVRPEFRHPLDRLCT